ncbi:hypothetical protein [Streptomyces sp. NPDC003635]
MTDPATNPRVGKALGGEPTAVGSTTADPAVDSQRATTPAPGTGSAGAPVSPVSGGSRPAGESAPLLPRDEADKLELRLQHALSGFVDKPRAAVEEAEQVVEEVTGRVTEALNQRRRTLRGSWQGGDAKGASNADTEQLRLALRDYRALADRLLHL